MLELLGDKPDVAQDRSRPHHGDRDRAGQGLADARRAARSLQALSQGRFQGPAGADSELRLGHLHQGHRPAAAEQPSTSRSLRSTKEFENQLKTRQPRRHQDVPALAHGPRRGAVSLDSVRQRELRVLQQDAARRAAVASAMEALRLAGGWATWRSARPGIRQPRLQPRAEAAHADHDQADRARRWKRTSTSSPG